MSQTFTTNIGRSSYDMYSSVTVAQNEPVAGAVMDRSICELNINSVALSTLNRVIFSMIGIVDYLPSTTYNPGDLIWYNDGNGDLFLLRCIAKNNRKKPDIRKNDSLSDMWLNESGWDNQNKNLTILDYGIKDLLSANAEEFIYNHEHDDQMHPYGKLSEDESSSDYLGNKLLKSDMSNLDYSSQKVFFPTEVKRLDGGSAVITGYSRKFGSKIIEYDIILKLASAGTIDYASLFDYSTQLSANNAAFYMFNDIGTQNINFQTNKSYFMRTGDMDIFAPPNSNGQSRCGLIVQFNRNDYVNTYSATIKFPVMFTDLNYMVFSNSILSQAVGESKTLVPSANDISWCDKTRKSITLLDITFPDATKYSEAGYNASHGGLAANSFHCKVIGQIGA